MDARDESLLLRHRLAQEFGLTLHPFRYSAAYSNMSAITARLDKFVRERVRRRRISSVTVWAGS